MQSDNQITLDLNSTPDLVPPVCAMAIFRKASTILNNIEQLRIKECDRIMVLTREFKKLGVSITSGNNYINILPSKPQISNAIYPENDRWSGQSNLR